LLQLAPFDHVANFALFVSMEQVLWQTSPKIQMQSIVQRQVSVVGGAMEGKVTPVLVGARDLLCCLTPLFLAVLPGGHLQLVAKAGGPATFSTKWEDLTPETQQLLQQVE
jgi:hypothetical protein